VTANGNRASVEISLYPLQQDYKPIIRDFIARVQQIDGIDVLPNDLSTQLFGDFSLLMQTLEQELAHSWREHGRGVFVVKFIPGDVRE
jgi:hypothetical protein